MQDSNRMTTYWLAHCHGFEVRDGRRRLGVVEEVVRAHGQDGPSALAVRGGLLGSRVDLVPVEAVARIAPRSKRILVARVPRAPEGASVLAA